VEEGNLLFTREKFSALDLTGRIQTIGSKCAPRTVKFDSPRLPDFRPVIGAVLTFIGLTGQCSGIEGFQVAILVHELSILGAKRGIKYTYKTATLTPSRGR